MFSNKKGNNSSKEDEAKVIRQILDSDSRTPSSPAPLNRKVSLILSVSPRPDSDEVITQAERRS